MTVKESLRSSATWERAAQFFVGFFFLAAAYHKLSQGFFGPDRVPLGAIFQHWINNGLPLELYRDFMLWIMPYADALSVVVIVLQAVAGMLLILNSGVRWAGLLIILLQGNIYLATYHHAELRVLGSQALWLGLFYLARPYMKDRLWSLMTYCVVFIGLMHLYARFQFGDPWLSAVAWQRLHFAENVMSSAVGIKHGFLWLTGGAFGNVVWAGAWWFKLFLMLGTLTRYRLSFGAAWLVLFFLDETVWLNAWNCEGAFWVLILFTWLTTEYALEHKTGRLPVSLLP